MDHFSRSLLNFFVSSSVDRMTTRRPDAEWIRERIRDRRTRIVPVWRSRNLLTGEDELRPVLLSVADLQDHPALERAAVLLGQREDTVYFAVELPPEFDDAPRRFGPGADFRELREVGPLLDSEDGALLAYARGIIHWHRRHRYCGDCGSSTESADGGHTRVCLNPSCGRKHFPRTDPAIIVLVTRSENGEERCLLGRQPSWPRGMHSAIAGFVEPGESLEQAVVREVREETDVAVGRVHYHSSQPWPFPSSIMLGFTAEALSSAITLLDGELQHAGWFSRDEMVKSLADGRLRVPRRVSIAYRLVEDWFDAGDHGRLADHLPPGIGPHIRYRDR
jgi:NAD+ diphosphatase